MCAAKQLLLQDVANTRCFRQAMAFTNRICFYILLPVNVGRRYRVLVIWNKTWREVINIPYVIWWTALEQTGSVRHQWRTKYEHNKTPTIYWLVYYFAECFNPNRLDVSTTLNGWMIDSSKERNMRSASALLLGSGVQIPLSAWNFVSCICCVSSGRCDDLITRPGSPILCVYVWYRDFDIKVT
jgi:hypothetical protein